VNAWWWLPIGFAAWFAVSIPVAVFVGRWLKASREAGEAQGQTRDKEEDP
jgi:hypothetical protein